MFGEMIDCGEPGALDYTLQDVVMRILAELRGSDSVWAEVRPCFERKYHPAFRSAGRAHCRGDCWVEV
jgi:hypothetical protein